jgi:AraC-like DNA-binding protein
VQERANARGDRRSSIRGWGSEAGEPNDPGDRIRQLDVDAETVLNETLRRFDDQRTTQSGASDVECVRDVAAQVARCIVESLSNSDVSIEYISACLGQSARTLQRRLGERGIRFRDMVDSIRLELSLRYLGDSSLSLTDIALRLGYSDLSAFSRAFRRWAGCSAIEFRQQERRKT